MTEEEKQLLLQDLSARLPYGVICTDLRHGDSKITEVNTEDGLVYCPDFDEYVKVENCHLYLRPMSSMTEDERLLFYQNTLQYNEETGYSEYTYKSIDWLNAHHFDYRGLIPKGLAIEVTEDNNPYK